MVTNFWCRTLDPRSITCVAVALSSVTSLWMSEADLFAQSLQPVRSTTTLVTDRAPFSHVLPSHGRFLVARDDGWLVDAWQARDAGIAMGHVFIRATSSTGRQHEPVQVTPEENRFFSSQFDLATDGQRVVLVWDAYRDGFEASSTREGVGVFLRIFDRDLNALSPVVQVSGQSAPARAFPSVTADRQSITVVFSADTGSSSPIPQSGGEWARRFDWSGQPVGSPFRLDEPLLHDTGADFPTVATLPDGGLVVGWTDFSYDQVGDAVTRVVDQTNELSSPTRFHHFPGTQNLPQELNDLVILPSGATMILGLDRGAKPAIEEPFPAAAFASVWSPSQSELAAVFGLSSLPAPHDEGTPSAVVVGQDGFFAAWTNWCPAEPTSCQDAGASAGLQVLGRQFDLLGRPMTEVQPLIDSTGDHFLHALSAPPQLDHARSLRTPTAVMTYEGAGTVTARRFSAPCEANGATTCLLFDRFAVSLVWSLDQDLEDTRLGVVTESGNGWTSFSLFDPNETDVIVKVLDARGLTGSHWVFIASLTDVAFEVRVLDTATGLSQTYTNPRGELASLGDTVGLPEIEAAAGHSTPDQPPSNSQRSPRDDARGRTETKSPQGTGARCVETAERLCWFDRFQAEVSWTDFDGRTGQGLRFDIDSSKAFWFFDADVPELAIKVLDGTPVNGAYWVYLASLTNVAFDLRITDLVTGREQVWRNQAGEFASFGNVTAFPVELPP